MESSLYIPISTKAVAVYVAHLFGFLCLYLAYMRGRSNPSSYLLLSSAILVCFYTISPIGREDLVVNPFGGVRLFRLGVLTLTFGISVLGLSLHKRLPQIGSGLKLYLLLALYAVFSSLYASNFMVSGYKATELLCDVVLLCFLSTRIHDANDCKSLIDAVYISLIFLVVTALVGIALFPHQALPWVRSSIMPFRLRGALPVINSNELSEMAAIVGVIAMNRMLSSPRMGSVIFNLSALLLTVSALVLSCSRTSIFAFAMLVIYLGYYWRRMKILIAAACLAIMVGALNYLGPLTEYLLRGESATSITSVGGRMAIWPIFWDRFLESPVIGHGFYTAFRFFEPTFSRGSAVSFATTNTTDNTYLEIALGLGTVGLLIVAGFLAASFFQIWSLRKERLLKMEDGATLAALKPELMAIFLMIVIRSFTGPTFSQHTFNSILLCCLMTTSHHLVLRCRQRSPTPIANESPALS